MWPWQKKYSRPTIKCVSGKVIITPYDALLLIALRDIKDHRSRTGIDQSIKEWFATWFRF
jgi:hypothetical protein